MLQWDLGICYFAPSSLFCQRLPQNNMAHISMVRLELIKQVVMVLDLFAYLYKIQPPVWVK